MLVIKSGIDFEIRNVGYAEWYHCTKKNLDKSWDGIDIQNTVNAWQVSSIAEKVNISEDLKEEVRTLRFEVDLIKQVIQSKIWIIYVLHSRTLVTGRW